MTNSTKQALEIALRENAKLKCDEIKGIYRFAFRPPIEGITNKKEFLKYICNYYNDGLGGLMKVIFLAYNQLVNFELKGRCYREHTKSGKSA